MRHHYAESDEYEELMQRTIDAHPDLHWIRNCDLAIGVLRSDWEKQKAGREVLGECILVKDIYLPFCPYDFLIVIYEPNTADLNDEQMEVLMYHELLHVDVKETDGEPVYAIHPHDVEDFRAVIDQYGIDWASGRR